MLKAAKIGAHHQKGPGPSKWLPMRPCNQKTNRCASPFWGAKLLSWPCVQSVSNRAAIIGSCQATSLTSHFRCEPPLVQRIRASERRCRSNRWPLLLSLLDVFGQKNRPGGAEKNQTAQQRRDVSETDVEQSDGRKSIGRRFLQTGHLHWQLNERTKCHNLFTGPSLWRV